VAIARAVGRLTPVIAFKETLQIDGIGIHGGERIRSAVLGLVLRLAAAQRLGQMAPERIEAPIGHLQQPTDIRRLGPIEIDVRFRRIGVFTRAHLQHAKRHQRIEEIARAALVQAEFFPQGVMAQRTLGQRREKTELHRTQERLRAPEAQAQAHDPVR